MVVMHHDLYGAGRPDMARVAGPAVNVGRPHSPTESFDSNQSAAAAAAGNINVPGRMITDTARMKKVRGPLAVNKFS